MGSSASQSKTEVNINYTKKIKKDKQASKADSRQEERTEKERSRGKEETRRDKAESLHRADASGPTAAEFEESELRELVDQFEDDVTVTVISHICKFFIMSY